MPSTRASCPIRTAYVPVGNGSLIIGVGAWLRSAAAGCRVVGVQSDAAAVDDAVVARTSADRATAATYADGSPAGPGARGAAMMVGRVDDMRLVSEVEFHAAQTELTAALGVTVEGSAAASWAGVLADPSPRDGAALVIVTGSNVPPSPAR